MSRFAAIVLAACVAAAASPAEAQSLPELTRPVNDFANVIRPAEEAQIESLIRQLQSASGDVIVVATVKTFQPEADIRTFATKLFENHGRGIGQKGKDNGMLVVVAVDDRQVWAEVGYDLEGLITDGFAGETSRQTIVPYFRRGDYGGGILAGVTTFARRIAEARNVTLDNVPLNQPVPTRDDGDPGLPFALIFFLFIVFLNVVGRVMRAIFGGRRGGRRRRWGSMVGPFGTGYGGGGSWGSGGGSFGGGFGGFGGGRSGGGGGGASW